MAGTGTGGRSQSLYRKYRPTTFAEDDLVGQDHVSRTLRNAVRHDRVAHAYLFCGPRGSGKTSSARLLAKAVNCEATDPDARPCNQCASCRTINEGRAVDIIEIDAASNRGIEDMRDLREKVRFSPSQLRAKFYIIDEVHQLTKEASNALLKTLEEPPPHVTFVLATTDPEKVIETISSRCQTFIFHRLPVEKMIEHLRRVCVREGISADDAALAAIARAATGSLRDALGLLDQLAAYGEEGIHADTVRQVLGAGSGEQVRALIDAIAAGDAAAGLRVINAVVDAGADARQFTAQVVEYLRALLHAVATGSREGQDQGDGSAVAGAHRQAFRLGEIAALVKRFSQVDYGLKHSAYDHLPLELCFIYCILVRGTAESLSAAQDDPPVAARPAPAIVREPVPVASNGAKQTVRRGTAPVMIPERPVETRPSAAPQRADLAPSSREPEPAPAPLPTAARSAIPTITIEQVHDHWPRIRQGVRAINRKVEALLSSADPYRITDDTLTLTATYDFHRNSLNKDDSRRILEEVVTQVLGAPYHVVCIGQDEAKAAPAPDPPVTPPVLTTPAPLTASDQVTAEVILPADEHDQGPTRPVAVEAPAEPPEAATGVADERYVTALRNLFNAEEIASHEPRHR